MTTTTAKGGFSLGAFVKRRAHEMVDARNARQEAEYRQQEAEKLASEQKAWNEQIAGLAMQSAYASEMAVIRDEARLAGLLVQHTSGFEVYTGILENASNEQVREWYLSHGKTPEMTMNAFKNRRDLQKSRGLI